MAGNQKVQGKKTPPALLPSPVVTLVKGQMWKFDNRCIRIGHVGKHLVEHQGVSTEHPNARAPIRMIAIRELQQFLAANQAVLVDSHPAVNPVGDDVRSL